MEISVGAEKKGAVTETAAIRGSSVDPTRVA
jgi:hypothetical protein